MDQGMSEYSGFISANRNTVKPHFIAPRFTAKLAYHQEFLQSRFSYVVITILYNKILQPWTDYFSFWIKLNKFVCVFFRLCWKCRRLLKRKRNLLDFRQKREIVEIKNPTNNETWEAARHRYIGKWCPPVTSTFWTLMKK